MKRLTILTVLAAASLLGGISHAAARAHSARAAKLELRHTALGSILVTGRGLTVYVFTRDARDRDVCQARSGCTGIWPPLTTHGTPTVGAGVRRSLVGTIKLADGTRQVTYAGHPLYNYIGDSGPGDTSYVGQHQFDGRWFALGAAGHTVR
jgi:predicted lipoprotein with Yx(FWY)xxD motif